MGKLVKSHGQMYNWVTHMIAHVGGECEHRCSYCYVDNPTHGRHPDYAGPVRLLRGALDVALGSGNTIFVDHMNDLWARGIPNEMIREVLLHCWRYRDNVYVFQTKNPQRYEQFALFIPPGALLGTTIETNRDLPPEFSRAPQPSERYAAMVQLSGFKRFVTIEPIVDFDVEPMVNWLRSIGPAFVNIGADSKGHGLQEPDGEKVRQLILGLRACGIEIREKHNLERLLDLSTL